MRGESSGAHQFHPAILHVSFINQSVFPPQQLVTMQSSMRPLKRPCVQSCGHHAGWVQYISTAPYWVGGQPHTPPPPQPRAPRAPHSHLSARRGARSGPRFSTSGNYDTNEKSVNQRVTHGQEDGFDTLLQLQSSLSL